MENINYFLNDPDRNPMEEIEFLSKFVKEVRVKNLYSYEKDGNLNNFFVFQNKGNDKWVIKLEGEHRNNSQLKEFETNFEQDPIRTDIVLGYLYDHDREAQKYNDVRLSVDYMYDEISNKRFVDSYRNQIAESSHLINKSLNNSPYNIAVKNYQNKKIQHNLYMDFAKSYDKENYRVGAHGNRLIPDGFEKRHNTGLWETEKHTHSEPSQNLSLDDTIKHYTNQCLQSNKSNAKTPLVFTNER